jgi:hypothetical protein
MCSDDLKKGEKSDINSFEMSKKRRTAKKAKTSFVIPQTLIIAIVAQLQSLKSAVQC